MNCEMHPSLPTCPLLNATTTPSGNHSNQGKKPRTPLPPIRKNLTPPGPWAKSDSEKVKLFANHLAEVFTPHDNTLEPEVERELATQTQHSENLQAFTLSELKQVIKQLNAPKAPGSDLITDHIVTKAQFMAIKCNIVIS